MAPADATTAEPPLCRPSIGGTLACPEAQVTVSRSSARSRRERVSRIAALRRARAEQPPVAQAPATPRRLVHVDAPNSACVPDLLHEAPSISVDHDKLKHALRFAFAAGDAAGGVRSALSEAAMARSSWRPESFADDLFLDALVRECADFDVGGRPASVDRRRLRRLLARPPAHLGDVGTRQDTLAALSADSEMLQALRAAYAHLTALFELLDEQGADSRLNMTRFRLDVLTLIKNALDSLDAPFRETDSPLRRLHDFAHAVRQSQAYEALAGLLEFEGDMARVDLQLRLGVDGRVRQMAIVKLDERATTPFYLSPWKRALRKLVLWLRGYRVGESELVDRWLDSVFEGILDELPYLVQLKGDLDFFLSAMHLRDRARRHGLQVCLPEILEASQTESPPDRGRRMEGFFNPLLLGNEDPPVPCDIHTPGFEHTCIITGPNSGGKTRLLQGLALAQILGQGGAFVPARAATIQRVPGLFVSLGEVASADQKEGRLGMELLRIRRMFEEGQPGSLVILDELCSGTNPSEAEEIFQMVLELLRALQPEVYISTHFLDLARRLQETDAPGALSFLQVELDAAERPTYQFVPGVATTSLARKTASRLGVTREQLLELVESKERHRG